MQSLVSLFRLTALLVLLMPFHQTVAVDIRASADPSSTALTLEAIKARIAEVESDPALDEAIRTRLTDLYNKALAQREKARVSKNKTDAYLQAREEAAAQARTIRDELAQAQQAEQSVTLDVPAATPLAEIDQRLLIEKANDAAVETQLVKLEEQLASEADRPSMVRTRQTAIAKRQEELATESKLPAPADELPALTEARHWLQASEEHALSAESRMLNQELLSQPLRIELLKAQRNQTAFSLERIRTRTQLLENMLSSRRVAEAEQAKTETEEAQLAALGKHPLVQDLAEQNAALSAELTGLATDLEQVLAEDNTANSLAQRISDDFSSSRQKLELAGMNQALGLVLLEQRRGLPELRTYRKSERAREQLIASAGLHQLRLVEELRSLDNIPDYIDGLTIGIDSEQVSSIRTELEELALNRRTLLNKVISTNQAYLRALSELDFAQRRLVDTLRNYDDYLAENLLWIRSRPLPDIEMLKAMPGRLSQLLSPARWQAVVTSLTDSAPSSPGFILALLVFALLLWKERAICAALRATGTQITKIRTDSFRFTFDALVLTLLLAISWPLLVGSIGWQLGRELDAVAFTRPVSAALTWVAGAWFYLRAFRMLCLRGGLAEAHFRWPADSLKMLRRELSKLMPIFLPTAFIALFVINLDSAALGGGVGRLAIVIILLALGMFFYRLFDPAKGVLKPYLARHEQSLFARLRYLWLALAVAIPVVLAGLAFIGYTYTAAILTGSLLDTLWFILLLVVIHQLVYRWLLLTRRRLAFQAAIERRDAARAAAAARLSDEPGSELAAEHFEEPVIDLATLGEESRKLLNVALVIAGIIGIWFIWSDVLPAFGYLDKITLWQYSSTISGVEKLVPVTLAKVILALLVIFITIAGTKRFPSFMEIALLQHLDMTAGGRYAATTLSRYVIAATGVVIALGMIGGSWDKIQWLVAALGVGIGFGLQEIVANFISGIIILFERPIRVGDYVSVGDTDGFVTRIQIRATTIQSRDRTELLVPNKEFITGRLLNWSLSDPVTRISVPVGIAYGSDVKQAMALMAEAAAENELVLEEPFPLVAFESFGDNSLLVTLRCFVDSLDYRLPVTSELHTAINSKFNTAGIVIAFPQRDLHLDTSQPLDIRVHHETVDGKTHTD
jgi:potassium efflux system protein